MADSSTALYELISRSGYHPEVVSAGLRDAVAGEDVISFIVQHEPTFDREEIRRHMTVLVMTPTRLVLVHTDEHPADELVQHPYTSTSCEAISLGRIDSVVVTRIVADGSTEPTEAMLSIGWGAMRRIDLEPAQCADPECEADHGYTGALSADDFTLRSSSTAEGGAAVERLMEFARKLSESTSARNKPVQ